MIVRKTSGASSSPFGGDGHSIGPPASASTSTSAWKRSRIASLACSHSAVRSAAKRGTRAGSGVGARSRSPARVAATRPAGRTLRGEGLAEADRAAALRGAHHGRALLGDAASEQRTAVLRRETRRVEDVLHTDGDALEASHRRTAAAALVRRRRKPPRTLLVEPR